MFKKIVFAAPVAVLALTSSMAFAAGEEKTTINIKANIPTSVFVARALDSEFGKDEEMGYNIVSAELSSLTAPFIFKHTVTNGAINGFIDGDAALSNGLNQIPLTVKVGTIELDRTSKEVISKTEATPGVNRDLTITAAKPAANQTGTYNANFTVVFEPTIDTTI
jgi:hypothetical protein